MADGDDTRPFGRLRAGLMGLLEVRLLERARRRGEKNGADGYADFLGALGERWGSRVLPIGTAIEPAARVLAGEEIVSLVERALVTEISTCYCRSTFRNCDGPLKSCIGLSFGESHRALRRRPPGRRANLAEIKNLIERCDELGLVHQTIYYPSPEYFYVICNCCPCCCLSFRNALRYGRARNIIPSDFIARFDPSKCNECGACLERCHFGALALRGGELSFSPELCRGCGLCVTTCPRGALSLRRREGDRP